MDSDIRGAKLSINYRYHFNGKETDDEWTGNGGDSYDFGGRFYDSRIGRWLMVDPHHFLYPYYSGYSAFANAPIVYIDPSGEDLILTVPNGSEDQKERMLTKYKNVITESFDGKVQVDIDMATGKVLGYSVIPGKEGDMSPYDYAAMDQMNEVAASSDQTTLTLYDHRMEGSESVNIDNYQGCVDLDDLMNAGSLDNNKRTRKGMLVHIMVEQQARQKQIAEGKNPEDATLKSRNHFDALVAENKCQHYKLTWDGLLPHALRGAVENNYVTVDGNTSWSQFEMVKDPDSGEIMRYEYSDIQQPPNGESWKNYMDNNTEPVQE